jgi:trans-2,3-dihydro-3-hydroxyanthranilate isomerase
VTVSLTRRFMLVDVFTDIPLAGNQLAVFTDARGLSDEQMQALALEIGFSECVFVFPPTQGGHARLRIFTPAEELPFAGHPVLGAAFVLAMPMQLVLINLETGAGVVPVMLEREGARIIFGTMAQPIPTVAPFERADELVAALGLERSELPVEVYDNGVRHVYVALKSAEAVAALAPDPAALALAGSAGVNCFHAPGDGTAVTRMFFPGVGVAEDPATGSAAGPLALHLMRHGLHEAGVDLEISQGAAIGRPSTLFARITGTQDSVEAVEVGGRAVIVGRGEFQL